MRMKQKHLKFISFGILLALSINVCGAGRISLVAGGSGEGESGPYSMDYRGHWENNIEFYVFNTH
jgi:hypothetical protein